MPLASRTFPQWAAHFRAKRQIATLHPWADSALLSDPERACITRSLQQFQLGEGSEGRSLIARAEQLEARNAEALGVGEAIRAFIGEEQRHSAMLGLFMDREGIPHVEHQWVDSVFRFVRKPGGFEFCMRVLASAEVIAIPFYRALFYATTSELLKSLCTQILDDEAEHLDFQSDCLALALKGRSLWLRATLYEAHVLFLLTTALVVWWQHGEVLRRGGFGRWSFLLTCFSELERLHARAEHVVQSTPEARPIPAARPSGC
jgi:hypothetical protein